MERLLFGDALARAFTQKRSAFVADYGLEEKPALIWQCMSVAALQIDVTSAPLRQAFEEGGQAMSDERWWCGFRAGRRAAAVFDGIAAHSHGRTEQWMTELHTDGHLVAGVWSFPESRPPQPLVCGVGDFYAAAFRDFGALAARVYAAMPAVKNLFITCTMQHADRLSLIADDGRVLASPPARQTLQWPHLPVASEQSLPVTCEAMVARFLRAYGSFPSAR
jgi:hypothetical protein